MAYRPPTWFVRHVFNPLAVRFGIGGAKRLSVRRRHSGGPQEIPVIPIEVAGDRYLVSPRGEADWVKNLRAAGGSAMLDGTTFTSVEVPVEERAPILAAYQRVGGRAVEPHFKALPQAKDHPVFRYT